MNYSAFFPKNEKEIFGLKRAVYFVEPFDTSFRTCLATFVLFPPLPCFLLWPSDNAPRSQRVTFFWILPLRRWFMYLNEFIMRCCKTKHSIFVLSVKRPLVFQWREKGRLFCIEEIKKAICAIQNGDYSNACWWDRLGTKNNNNWECYADFFKLFPPFFSDFIKKLRLIIKALIAFNRNFWMRRQLFKIVFNSPIEGGIEQLSFNRCKMVGLISCKRALKKTGCSKWSCPPILTCFLWKIGLWNRISVHLSG